MEAPRKLELKIQITGIAGGGRLPQNAKYVCGNFCYSLGVDLIVLLVFTG